MWYFLSSSVDSSVLDSPCLLGTLPSYIFITMHTSSSISVHITSFPPLCKTFALAAVLSFWRSPRFRLSGFLTLVFSSPPSIPPLLAAVLLTPLPAITVALTSLSGSSAGLGIAGPIIFLEAVPGLLLPSLATRVQFSIPEILPLYLFHPHFCL